MVIQVHGIFTGGKGRMVSFSKRDPVDPSYSVVTDLIYNQLRLMSSKGHVIGLHQSFDAWQDETMRLEKETIEEAIGQAVTVCRQHWLRFSFRDTWKAQAKAGLRTDMTLGFNDRPGFRNSSAVPVRRLNSGIE